MRLGRRSLILLPRRGTPLGALLVAPRCETEPPQPHQGDVLPTSPPSSVRRSPSSCQHTGSGSLPPKPLEWLESCSPSAGRCISAPPPAGTGARSLPGTRGEQGLTEGLCQQLRPSRLLVQRGTAGTPGLEPLRTLRAPCCWDSWCTAGQAVPQHGKPQPRAGRPQFQHSNKQGAAKNTRNKPGSAHPHGLQAPQRAGRHQVSKHQLFVMKTYSEKGLLEQRLAFFSPHL